MSSQNQMFSPQEDASYEQLNTDPREQPYEAQGQQGQGQQGQGQQAGVQDSYEAGYGWTQPGGEWMGGEKLRPGQRGKQAYSSSSMPDALRNLSTWQWVIIVIVLLSLASTLWWLLNSIVGILFLVLGVIAAFVAISQNFLRKMPLPTQVFPVSAQPTLVLSNPVGSIRIHRGTSDSIEVRGTKNINGWLGSAYEGIVNSTQQGNVVNISARSNYQWSYLGGLRSVDFDITVPEFSDIQIGGNASTIKVEGISGRYQLRTDAGTIQILQGTLRGQSRISTSAGTIQVRQADLSGSATFVTNAGTIQYEGLLAPQGTYNFTTNLGTIDVALPTSSSFLLKASTDLGTINNQFGSNLVGEQPHATLELKTNLGTINVRKTF